MGGGIREPGTVDVEAESFCPAELPQRLEFLQRVAGAQFRHLGDCHDPRLSAVLVTAVAQPAANEFRGKFPVLRRHGEQFAAEDPFRRPGWGTPLYKSYLLAAGGMAVVVALAQLQTA